MSAPPAKSPAGLSELLAAAKAMPERGKPNMVQYTPIVEELRKRKYTYPQIFKWLQEKGEPLEEKNFSSFQACLSRRLNGKTGSLQKKAAKMPENHNRRRAAGKEAA